VAVGVENVSSKEASPIKSSKIAKESIDFLHFIRYMNIIYKSDTNIRLKFLYGVSLKSKYIYLVIFF